ncbi:MAG: hypothetical protein ACM3NH_04005 [Candidatus Saccharibacteria bacterium]
MIFVAKNSALKRWALIVLALFCLLCLESGFFGRLAFLPVVPGLLVTFIACVFTFGELKEAYGAAIVAGVFLDFASGLPDGVLLLSLVVSLSLLSAGFRRFFSLKASTQAALPLNVVVLTVLNSAAVAVFSKLFALAGLGQAIEWRFFAIHGLPWLLLFNLLMAYPMLYLQSILGGILKERAES